MAKRRKLVAPSSADLTKLEEEFRRETSVPEPAASQVRGVAPIAKIAADAAAVAQPASVADRARQAQLEASEAKLNDAQTEGRLLVDIPVGEINADAMVRDRAALDPDDMLELRLSISANGLRLPIEVYELPGADGGNAPKFGLLSGYRRLMAVRELLGLTEDAAFKTIRAIIRPKAETDAAFVAMVEENEVRSELSHFERGRIAVISAQQGAFLNVEDAVNKLFATGSKAKRSKVRSFALIFEELGDMLEFPDALSEKRGLKLAQALRQGGEDRIRDGLAAATYATSDEEWAVIESVIETLDAPVRDPKRGGRPRAATQVDDWGHAHQFVSSNGVSVSPKQDAKGFVLRFEGRDLDAELMDGLMEEIRTYLERS
ncbi:ParB N-terminal domain-containing protein [Shimia sp. MMG029]|uniref:ParB N-terminal domain-containing protein n=1 Tax=Shimia sp. MMG029 TaxID=3021978 RepID=UPI0022FDBDD3|nr:ParB N-terminal domain-containing protein [Shimia sp. MMG029]MDA5558981.1 ParB N-terminal domain-containing protein [Shimia sp. MMG029]